MGMVTIENDDTFSNLSNNLEYNRAQTFSFSFWNQPEFHLVPEEEENRERDHIRSNCTQET